MKKNLLKTMVIAAGVVFGINANAQNWNWSLVSTWYKDSVATKWTEMDFDAGNNSKVVAFTQKARIATSTDGGANWSVPQNISGFTINSLYKANIRYTAPNELMLANGGKIYTSADHGQSFTMVKDYTNNTEINMIDAKGNLILMGCSYGELIRSKNKGVDFLPKEKIFPTSVRTQVKVMSENFAYCYSKDGIKYTTDMGESWINLPVDSISFISGGNEIHFALPHSTLWQYWITAKSKDEWFIRVQYSNDSYYFKTTNGGQTWQNITNSFKGICGLNPYVLAEFTVFETSPGGEIFARMRTGKNHNVVLYSPDFGETILCDTVDGPPNYPFTAPDDLNIGFRIVGNKAYLLSLGSSGTDSINLYSRTISGGSVGIYETANALSFNVFPNPANNVVTITNIPEGSTINITDITGKTVHRVTAAHSQVITSIDGLLNGIYFVYVESKMGSSIKKLIINH